MSTSTTVTTTHPSHSLVLVDYELHRSGPPSENSTQSQYRTEDSRVDESHSANSPLNWPTDHRRVPAYRPVNTNLDPEERIVFNNRGEQMFIRTMFFGIQVVTVCALNLKRNEAIMTNFSGIPQDVDNDGWKAQQREDVLL